MSVFGGDSWVPEAQHRKRRVDDLLLSSSSSAYKKLNNGKFACLVCRHNPVLDSPLILSMHMKSSRHIAEETKLKGKKLSIQEEVNKRIALSGDSKDISNSIFSFSKVKGSRLQNKPLIEKTRQAILETQNERIHGHKIKNGCNLNIATASSTLNSHNCSLSDHLSQQTQQTSSVVHVNHSESITEKITLVDSIVILDWNAELQKRREKELQFTAAGWKRDGHGKWYKDENVEFDSDEEDPNVFCS